MIDLTELQAEVHALAREKGWYDDRDLSDPDVSSAMLCLIHSEVSEALECTRRGEMSLEYEQKAFDGTVVRWSETPPADLCLKPVGFSSELADVVIRCLDFAAAFDLGCLDVATRPIQENLTPIQIASCLQSMNYHAATGDWASLSCLLDVCFGLARALGFDLLEVIKIKHEYNKTRPIRHGGKAL